MSKPGLCVSKGVQECEKTKDCTVVLWWLGAMGHEEGDAGSIFLGRRGGVTKHLTRGKNKNNMGVVMAKTPKCKANNDSPLGMGCKLGRCSGDTKSHHIWTQCTHVSPYGLLANPGKRESGNPGFRENWNPGKRESGSPISSDFR